jgi:hypothetical protein
MRSDGGLHDEVAKVIRDQLTPRLNETAGMAQGHCRRTGNSRVYPIFGSSKYVEPIAIQNRI